MKPKTTSVIRILSLVLPIVYFCAEGKAQEKNFNEALKKAKDEGKILVVDVYTDWCGWCKVMDRDTYGNSKIKKIIEESFVLVKLDAEGNEKITYMGKEYSGPDLAAYFQVTAYPTTVFLEPGGKIIEFKYDGYVMNSIPGYLNARDFRKILRYFRDGRYKDTDLSTIL